MTDDRLVPDGRLSPEVVRELLGARRRRYLLYYLYRYANPVRLPDVADRVVEWEHGVPGEALLEERLHIYNDLYHSHVPKLAAADVVAYSQTEDMVELSRNAAQLRAWLVQTVGGDENREDVSP